MAINQNIDEQVSHQKVAIYIRVSTHWQADKDSLQVQKRELIAYSEMVLNINDYEIFEDPGYSAKNTDRPSYQRMIERLRTGEFSHLLVWKIDRISRNLLDFASMYKELKQLGITFVSKNEQFDTSSAIGEAMLKIILVFAELERNMTSERVTAVMLSRASNGQWNGGRVPFGYSWDKEEKTFSIIEDEASTVRRMYNLYEENQSLLYVARTLNNEGIYTRAGNMWSVAVVHRILNNPFYIGTYRYYKHEDGNRQKVRDEDEWIVYENHHPPIIDEIQFDRVQFVLQRNWRGGYKRGESHRRKNVHIFAGLVKCGNCGNNMSATLDRRRANGLRPSIYGCATRRRNKNACENKFVSDMVIGPFVMNYISNILRAKNTMSNSTSVTVLERKLLRGPCFTDVDSIGVEGLHQLRDLLLQGQTGIEYRPNAVYNAAESPMGEIELLQNRKRKEESALNRLRSLYLYGDSEIPEKDYIIERQKIIDSINKCDKDIAELKEQLVGAPDVSSEFTDKASYFIMVEKLIKGQYFNYEKYIPKIDSNIPRNFIVTVIDTIEITNGRISSIKFKNGMLHTFNYKT